MAEKKAEDIKVVINGAGAAGACIAKLLLAYGVKNVIVCDSKGAIYKGRQENMNPTKKQLGELCNKDGAKGNLEEVLEGADVFIGVSVGGALKGEWLGKMNKPIIFAMANP